MMSSTELLRRLLDERGVEWEDHSDEKHKRTDWDNGSCWFIEYEDGWTQWGMSKPVTPEQAIAATLGNDGAAELQAENAKLRDEFRKMDEWHSKELVAAMDENARLRELVEDMYCLAFPSTVEWEVSDATYDKYSPCEKCNELHGGKSPCASTSKDMTEECCKPIQAAVVAERMRELGVEVDA